MEILDVSAAQYASIVRNPPFVYASFEFNNLNASKCNSVKFLLFKEGHFRLAIIGGIKNNIFFSPFSAPFCGFTFLDEHIRIEYIDKALLLLLEWIKNTGLSGIYITLPPFFYGESNLVKLVNCFYRKSFTIDKVDLNHYFKLEKFSNTYINHIRKEARKNLRASLLNHLSFSICTSLEEKAIAYDVISQNRLLLGYSLKMSFDQVIETAKIVNCDFFLVREIHNHPVAAAIVVHVSTEIAQVIYWGDLRDYFNLRPMNYLSYKVFEYYSLLGKKIVDVGTSTEDSLPNNGLCVFKESIGCRVTTKFSFAISF